ncbi:isoprenoid synthase domain-containing protein [Mycena rosella]|uniref:(2E,6E)-farnesyl diphosphate synthase n=1 Tax=Mycena rosella TaxID=1033263 RepID=A0AAD7DCU4_MYCRO|nr:isoprenoid synthase domain-containing protein [Mycena rosella]
MRRWTDASSALVRTRTRCKARPYSFLAQKQVQLPEQTRRDPAALVAPELDHLRQSLLGLLGSAHPGLDEIAKYYFLHPSKQMRPLLVLLFARATNGLGEHWRERHWAAECEGAGGRAEELDRPLTRADVLNDWNPSMPDSTTSFESVFSLIPPKPRVDRPSLPPAFALTPSVPALASPFLLLPTQRRLAQIVEMIHVASLLHDDVIDTSTLRRGVPSAPAAFGNKLSVLGGDFLLGRASTALSRLGDFEVVELIASVIANLVEGEILQMKDVYTPELGLIATPTASKEAWSVYLKKTYLKTASLMAKGCRASVILGGCSQGEVWKEVAYAFGRNFGLAFQLVDDVLDYEAGEATLGKPGGADLQLGLATGPALYAWEEHPEMGSLILRKFENEGDVELARDLVRRSSGVARTRDLARAHSEKARELLQLLPDSDAKVSLEMLTERVVTRTW